MPEVTVVEVAPEESPSIGSVEVEEPVVEEPEIEAPEVDTASRPGSRISLFKISSKDAQKLAKETQKLSKTKKGKKKNYGPMRSLCWKMCGPCAKREARQIATDAIASDNE